MSLQSVNLGDMGVQPSEVAEATCMCKLAENMQVIQFTTVNNPITASRVMFNVKLGMYKESSTCAVCIYLAETIFNTWDNTRQQLSLFAWTY